MTFELPYRQIHLDFHTSEWITGIGADFDSNVFADTLARAHVNSINLFARCHHGWVYYDTAKFPERRHPHLTRDLLRQQIDACHARGIKTPVYVTVQWDHYTALRHPEWRVLSADGRLEGTPPYEDGFYRRLCLNTPYVDWLKSFILEVVETIPGDGLWLDIVDAQDCSCAYCRQGMLNQGLNPALQSDRIAFGEGVLRAFQRDMTEFIHALNPELLIFYNAGHVGPRHRAMIPDFTHLELESLPSGGWGYLHFPIAARYARTLGKDYLGMTGKFQTSWGDFHSFKNRAALEFETFHMLALNGKCCIGDQLLPHGRLCPETYRLVGSVYSQVEAIEPWCQGAQPVTEIGVLTPEEHDPAIRREQVDFRPIMGATRMLQEGGHQFDILDSKADFNRYRVLVLPDKIPTTGALLVKLTEYLAQGGAVIASFASGMNVEQTAFELSALGVTATGEGPRDRAGQLVRGREDRMNGFIEYLLPRAEFGSGLPETEHAMYMRGIEIDARDGSVVLADTVSSFFDRDYLHFCSHRQTPSSGKVVHPAIVQHGQTIYFSHPIFSQYQTKAPRWCKQAFLTALARLLPQPLVRITAPSAAIATLNDQPAEDRWVLHILCYIPERRCEQFDVIEDVIPLHDVLVSVRTDRPVSRVACAPQGLALDFTQANGRVSFVIPKVAGYQVVEICR